LLISFREGGNGRMGLIKLSLMSRDSWGSFKDLQKALSKAFRRLAEWYETCFHWFADGFGRFCESFDLLLAVHP
jgi:hypothetical protein